jgi:hypothetical protein
MFKVNEDTQSGEGLTTAADHCELSQIESEERKGGGKASWVCAIATRQQHGSLVVCFLFAR